MTITGTSPPPSLGSGPIDNRYGSQPASIPNLGTWPQQAQPQAPNPQVSATPNPLSMIPPLNQPTLAHPFQQTGGTIPGNPFQMFSQLIGGNRMAFLQPLLDRLQGRLGVNFPTNQIETQQAMPQSPGRLLNTLGNTLGLQRKP